MFMPSKLPAVMPKKAIKAFSKAGWRIARQKGSHIHLSKTGKEAILTIPRHNKPLKRGVLRTLIKRAGLTVDEFVKLL